MYLYRSWPSAALSMVCLECEESSSDTSSSISGEILSGAGTQHTGAQQTQESPSFLVSLKEVPA